MNFKRIIIATVLLSIAGVVSYFFYSQNIFESKKINIVQTQNSKPAIFTNEEEMVEIVPPEEEYEAKKNADKKSEKETIVGEEEKGGESENSKEKSLSIISQFVSWGHQKASARKIDTIIIHSSYDALGTNPYDLAGLIKEYKQYGVAPHYLIDREGKIYLLVAEENIAYHAGKSRTPDGRTNVNNFSIGIELMNKEDADPTSNQYLSLKKLIAEIKKRHKIKYVLGHKQIASERKTDPWNFEWEKINR